MGQELLRDWSASHANSFGDETLLLHHRLKDSGLFSRQALAELIGNCSSEHYNLNTMGHDPEASEWREGVIGDASGEDVLASIERGRIWLNLRGVEEIDPRYKTLLDEIFDEISARVPDFAPFKTKLGILVSSPKVQVYYHADIPGQMLWHLEGTKRIYIYPTTDKFLSQQDLEGIITGETEEDLPFDSIFDDEATIYHLQPDQMLFWPLNSPHRVTNDDCINISVTTEHYTDDIRKSYAVNYANGILRRVLGLKHLSRSLTSPLVYPKAAFAMLWRTLKLNRSREIDLMVDFAIDTGSKTGIKDIPAYAK
jgi:hypothetical protein